MNFAQEQNASSRIVGFGIVILIHIILVWAIATGLARKVYEKVAGPIETKVIEEKVKPPPPPEKVVPPPPDIKAPPPPFVPVPEVQIQAPAPPAVIAAVSTAPPPTTEVTRSPPPVAAPVAAKPTKITAAMVCTKMGKPEPPSVNWSGEALYKAVATVKAGRVTSVEITPLRGGVDRKAQRAMISAITQTLQDTYECPGDHVFEQEFQFKMAE